MVLLSSLVVLVLSTLSLFQDLHFTIQLLISFCDFFLMAGVLLVFLPVQKAGFLVQKTMALAIIAINAWIIAPSWSGEQISRYEPSESRNNSSIFYANLNSQNKNKNAIVKQIRDSGADVLMLVEVNTAWAEVLSSLSGLYPYSKMFIHEGNFGQAILSKTKLSNVSHMFERTNRTPALFADIESGSGITRLALLHPYPPLGSEAVLLRDRYLESVAFKVKDMDQRIIICGDFNATAWTSIFQRFLEISGATDPPSTSFKGTWPSQLPGFRIKIDHCVSKNLQILDYKILQKNSSDHLPLLLKVPQ